MFKCNNNTIINAKVYKYFIKSTFLLKKIKYLSEIYCNMNIIDVYEIKI